MGFLRRNSADQFADDFFEPDDDIDVAPSEEPQGVSFWGRHEHQSRQRRTSQVPNPWTENGKPADLDRIIRRGETFESKADLIAQIMAVRNLAPHERHNASAQIEAWLTEGWLTFYAGEYARPEQDPKPKDAEESEEEPKRTVFTSWPRTLVKRFTDSEGYTHIATKEVGTLTTDYLTGQPVSNPATSEYVAPENPTHRLLNRTKVKVQVPQLPGRPWLLPGEAGLFITAEQARRFEGHAAGIFEVAPVTHSAAR